MSTRDASRILLPTPAAVLSKSGEESKFDDNLKVAETQLDFLLLHNDRKGALEAAIEAASLCMEVRRKASNPSERQRLDRKCNQLLSIAENLKAGRAQGTASLRASGRPHRVPLSWKRPTAKEEKILLKSSKVNGNVFPPWSGSPTADEFHLSGVQFS